MTIIQTHDDDNDDISEMFEEAIPPNDFISPKPKGPTIEEINDDIGDDDTTEMANPQITEQGDVDLGTIIPPDKVFNVPPHDDESVYDTIQQEFQKADDNLNPKFQRVLDQLKININFMAANFPHDSNPNTFEQAMLRPDRDNWIEDMQKEYKNMHQKKVWKVIKKSDIVGNTKTILGNRWVFKKKQNGTYRCCLFAKGYHQVLGIDYTYSYAPVVTDTMVCCVLVIYLMNPSWTMISLDVETAFLYGKLDEPLYMDIPPGFMTLVLKYAVLLWTLMTITF